MRLFRVCRVEPYMSDDERADNELLEQCRAGSHEAFEVLYRRYRLRVYSFLNRLLPGQSAQVDDLFQQVWLRVLDGLPNYQHRDRFISWLFRIAHNAVVDHVRRSRQTVAAPVDETLPDPGLAPWDRIDTEALERAVAVAVAELPVEQREVALLRQQGVSFKDIAVIQGVGINTVLGRMHYAVRKLQGRLEEWR